MMDMPLVGAGVVPGDKIIVNVLIETSRLLQKKGWNKFSMARGPLGEAVSPDSIDASSYCLSGALVRAWRTVDPENENFYFRYFEKTFSEALRTIYGYEGTFTRWNDEVATCADDVVTLIHSVITSILQEDPAPPVEGDPGLRLNFRSRHSQAGRCDYASNHAPTKLNQRIYLVR